MRIALAQTHPRLRDFNYNFHDHAHLARDAAGEGCEAIFFPELSLTGYVDRGAETCTLTEEGSECSALQGLARRYKLVMGVGMPLAGQQKPRIATVFFHPEGRPTTYAKQWLHADEQPFFEAGNAFYTLDLSGGRVVPATCYEVFVPAHLEGARALSPDLYLVSGAKPVANLERAVQRSAAIARDHRLAVALVNQAGPAEGFVAAGGTTAWDRTGKQLGQLGTDSTDLLVVDF